MDHQNATHHCDEFLVSHVDSWTVVQDGSWTAVNPPLTGGTGMSFMSGLAYQNSLSKSCLVSLPDSLFEAVETSVAEHDTTGGMAAKIAEAASIASVGIPVYVVEVCGIRGLFQVTGISNLRLY